MRDVSGGEAEVIEAADDVAVVRTWPGECPEIPMHIAHKGQWESAGAGQHARRGRLDSISVSLLVLERRDKSFGAIWVYKRL